ncbi:pSer/pThr/pTyr-binding forkhead associated (FHA) protein [Litorivivens lipolytica]|uniref:PSer/pThr/pTyr-binding forkhead associated (FHA) protein n=1 Tax=Litorivivens lipolytica TaxID=1524264 RepID=A0A7W4W2Y7_9GAMM|nr:FHA domain-containing protein [Litorivivens lipolytica]MBB3046496.1 pSer/pThr/pTyr-binding forkhead associated (FHA) protein [Litorivivens lipolytica]
MGAKFLLVSVDNGDEFTLNDGGSYTIGRNPDCDLVVTEGYPSRQHARISVKDGQITLEDLGSTNGTFVNKRQIDMPIQVKPGDVIKFDSAAYHLVSPESGSSTLVMRNLGSTSQIPASSSIVIEDGEQDIGSETAFHQAFPLPADWAEAGENSQAFGGGSFSKEEIDKLLESCLPKDRKVNAALVITSGNHKSRVVGLIAKGDSQRWTIGRSEKCQFPLTDSSVSSEHAVLQYLAGSWELADTNSTNGIKINGRREMKGRLRDGDKLSLGQVNMVFRLL